MSAKAQKQTFALQQAMSALSPKADIALFNPVGLRQRPKALAASRLIKKSNLVDCITGRSAGFSPIGIRPFAEERKLSSAVAAEYQLADRQNFLHWSR